MPLNVRELGKSFFLNVQRWFHKLPAGVRFNRGWPRSTEKLLPSSHPFSVSMRGWRYAINSIHDEQQLLRPDVSWY